jgi:alpha-tubulin suppressor-like RCC1 family protein
VVGVGGTGYLTGVSQISAGKYHACALVSGAVYCWGQNDYGQLGNNTSGANTDSSTPVRVVGVGGTGYLAGVTQVSSGGGHTCALRSDGTIDCWGYNPFGQLGNNDTTNTDHPVQVSGITNAIQLAVGHNHTCALLSDQTVWCWGYNVYGEVGDGTTGNRSTPVQVLGASGAGSLGGVTSIGSGRFHSCALISDGTVYCWGDNENGELGNGTKSTVNSVPVRAGTITTASTISAGEYHSCAVLQDGTAQCWGAAAFGQVGDGTTADSSSPVTVIGPGGYGTLTGIATVSAGGGNWPDGNGTDNYEHTCALLTDGTVVTWGQNIYGQLGDGTTTMSISPVGVLLQ